MPSIGSITQRRALDPSDSPCSSPRIESDGYVAAILSLMDQLHQARMMRHDDARMAARLLALTTVPILQVCERHPQFRNVFRSTLRGLLLKW